VGFSISILDRTTVTRKPFNLMHQRATIRGFFGSQVLRTTPAQRTIWPRRDGWRKIDDDGDSLLWRGGMQGPKRGYRLRLWQAWSVRDWDNSTTQRVCSERCEGLSAWNIQVTKLQPGASIVW